MSRSFPRLPLVLFLLLAACASPIPAAPETPMPETPAPPAATAPATAVPSTTEPAPAETAGPQAPALSFDPATYRDEAAGFEFEYPASWSLTPGEQGERAAVFQLTFEGAPRLTVTLQRWDPRGDLPAFVAKRQQAWSASGFTVVSEEPVVLTSGQPAAHFVIETSAGDRALHFFTILGERYLELSGEGELELLAEITGTVRLLESAGPPEASAALGCLTAAESTLEWTACNVMDGIRSSNLSALHTFMTDPFALGYWGSEGRLASPEEVTAELDQDRLPADASLPLTFTAERSAFPPLAGQPPEGLFGPGQEIALILYSEGWGPQGAGAALLYFTRQASGEYRWSALAYSDQHFDR